MTVPTEMLIAALWLGPFFLLIRLGSRTPRLADFPRAAGKPVSVIIPARNEEANIGTVLESVMASSYDALEIIVVDDRSTDETAAIVRACAAGDSRIRLVEGEEIPPGWFGKPWACHQGYQSATADILLFTDADTIHGPALIGHAVGALHARQADLLTVAPHQLCLGFWERVIMPQVWALLGVRYHPRTVNRGKSSRSMIANGQFIMMPRRSYEAIGTHESVKGAVAEDLALAQRTAATGRQVFFAFATELMATRMYRGLGQLVEGWSKNMYLGGRQSLHDHPALRALLPVFFSLVGIFWLTPLALWVAGAMWGAPVLMTGGVVATLLSVLFWALVSAGMKIPAWYGLFYPLGVVSLMYIAGRSIFRGDRRVEWRGRTYRIPEPHD
jgi:chlorobactene glucosyltransferase